MTCSHNAETDVPDSLRRALPAPTSPMHLLPCQTTIPTGPPGSSKGTNCALIYIVLINGSNKNGTSDGALRCTIGTAPILTKVTVLVGP